MSSSRNPFGRPRSDAVTDRLHQAVFDILKDRPYTDLSLEQIAARAGVSRPALYRRYGNLGRITLGALLSAGAELLPMAHTEDIRVDLESYFRSVAAALALESAIGRALRGALASALTDPSFTPDFASFISARRSPVRHRLIDWRGELTEHQLDTALDAMFGPILYRLLIRQVPVDDGQIREIVARTLKSFGSD